MAGKELEPLLLSIDSGTQSVRALLFDLQGGLIEKTKVDLEPYTSPQPGWAEQDPRAWWNGCCVAIQAALAEAQVDPADIAGVGVCGYDRGFGLDGDYVAG